jgi:cob(I)alamin adenosyltransferase
MKIYTRGGDSGKTSLFGGERVEKSDKRINLLGNLDELNSFIGVLSSGLSAEHSQKAFLTDIQSCIFTIGAEIANPNIQSSAQKNFEVFVLAFEQQIDALDENLKPLKNFILPGGHPLAAASHVCRSVTRRCERMFFELAAEDTILNTSAGRYLNRLSDYFFNLARSINNENGVEDVIWQQS